MEKSKLSIMKRRQSTDMFNDEPPPQTNSTPIRPNPRSEDEESPYFPCSTQEMREDVDVLWDYNSPQSRPNKTAVKRKTKKRLNLPPSPKVPFRRHPSNNNEQIKQDFSKVREELTALRAEIARPDHEVSLVLSPREEDAFKFKETLEDGVQIEFDQMEEHCSEDPFNDDMDDQLILFSQQVMESEVLKTDESCPSNNKTSSSNYDAKEFKQQFGATVSNNFTATKKDQIMSLQDSEVFNDSFDNVLSQMNEDDFDQLTQVADIKMYKNCQDSCSTAKQSKVFPRTLSESKMKFASGPSTVSGKVEWHRTQSFESYNNAQLSSDKIQEIERKRLQAKAKLQAKKKQEAVVAITINPAEYSDSPLKCSPEEIEKKRLLALAKLEAKRQREVIEKKKQEALRRREEHRRIHASQVKSSLSTRL